MKDDYDNTKRAQLLAYLTYLMSASCAIQCILCHFHGHLRIQCQMVFVQ